MVSLGAKLESRKGVGPGFDLLRVALAVSVVAWHCDPLLHGGAGRFDQAWPVWFLGYAILTMFFALSGFLIAGSALRHSPATFLANRGLRIFPALIVEVVLCAFLLGPVFTTHTPSFYFSSAGTWHYLTNIVGLINFQLPGVFTAHPSNFVNLSLWTIPYELACYAFMTLAMAVGFARRPGIVLFSGLAVIAIGLAATLASAPLDQPGLAPQVFRRVFTGDHSRVFVGFTFGITMYAWRHRIPYSRWLLCACLAICVALALCGPAERLSFPLVNLLGAPALAYLTAYIGVSDLPTLPVFRHGDYSYGVYLYGFPIQQVTLSMFPSITSDEVLFAVSLPLVVLFSIFSWHCIEKPVLRLRRRFSFMSTVRLSEARAAASPVMPVQPALAEPAA